MGTDNGIMAVPGTSSRTSIRWRLLAEDWGASILLVPIAVVLGFQGAGLWLGEALWALMSAFNLIVHESGHFFFRFFGRFMMFAGGTIMELALPAVFVFQGLYHHNRLGTQLALLWLGQAFVGVSVYAADAQDRALPLLGNLGPESHDWHNILTMVGMLEQTPLVAATLFVCGVICWIAMALLPRLMP